MAETRAADLAGYWFDETAADAAVAFFAKHLRFTTGEWAGKPFRLEPWQEHDIIRPAFGWKRADGTRRYRRVYVWVPRKNGKALCLETPIPTPRGWSTMGELQVGDEIFDDAGRICHVTFATEVMEGRPCFRVLFTDGTSIVADADHQWLAKPKDGAERIVTTAEMAERLHVGDRPPRVERNWTIRTGAALDFPDAPTLGHPRALAEQSRLTRGVSVEVVAIDPVPSVPVRCIRVDSPSRLYLAGPGMTVTHNTELAAGVALLMLLGDGEPGGQVYSVARDEDQAKIVFLKAGAMVQWSEDLAKCLTVFKTSIWCAELAASFKPLSGTPSGKHGLNMSGLVGDEIHEWPDGRLYTFVHQSTAARRQPLEFLISTAGKRDSYGWEEWDYCCKVRDGLIDDPETLVVIYAAGPDDDWTDRATWAAANPNLGVSVKLDYLEAECTKARQNPRLENDFKNFHLNLWTSQAVRWLQMEAWDACGFNPRPVTTADYDNGRWKGLPEMVRHRRCTGGLDLSATTDLTALVWLFAPEEDDEPWIVVPRFFMPEARVEDRVRMDRMPYDRWVRSGALFATPGNVVDYAFVKAQIEADAELFDIGAIGVDPFNAVQLTTELQADGFDAIFFRQGFLSMSPPSKELERLVVKRQIDHGGHPVLRMCAENVAVTRDPAGNIKPAKDKSTGRIDGVVATINALGVALSSPDAGPSVYETRGLLTVGG